MLVVTSLQRHSPGVSADSPEKLPAAVHQLVEAARQAEDEQDAAEEQYVTEAEKLLDLHEQLQAEAAAAAEAYREAYEAQQASTGKAQFSQHICCRSGLHMHLHSMTPALQITCCKGVFAMSRRLL